MRSMRLEDHYSGAIISSGEDSGKSGMILAFWSGPAVEVNFGPPGRVLATLRGWGNESVAG
jgi:hypothetical protein